MEKKEEVNVKKVYHFTLYRVISNKMKIEITRTNISEDNEDLLIATFKYYYSLLEILENSQKDNYMVEIERTEYHGMKWVLIHILSFTRRKVIENWWKYDK